MENHKNVLIVGMSKMGKTHFGGQLYGRLKTLTNKYKSKETPGELSLFDNVLERLNDGLEGSHTDVKLHETITLHVESPGGEEINIVYPEYGGEQIKLMIGSREINPIWQKGISESDNWFLFIRPDLIEDIDDVTTKFFNELKTEREKGREEIKKIPENSSAFYVELLQAFLFAKNVSVSGIQKPNLVILLSCWDKLDDPEKTIPEEHLKKKMPMLHSFISSNWPSSHRHFMGLASTGTDLHKEKPNEDFAIDGPDEKGYFITPEGKKELDLTLILDTLIK